jgi:hypothetical protein
MLSLTAALIPGLPTDVPTGWQGYITPVSHPFQREDGHYMSNTATRFVNFTSPANASPRNWATSPFAQIDKWQPSKEQGKKQGKKQGKRRPATARR